MKKFTREEFLKLSLPEMLAIGSLIELATDPVHLRYKDRFPTIYCKNGESLSVQASRLHYSSPSTDEGPYTAVEVGYPSFYPPETWAEYAEDWSDPRGTVYSRVPVILVLFAIAANGGIDYEKTFKDWSPNDNIVRG